MNDSYFCMCPVPKNRTGMAKAALLNAFKWNKGEIISIAFLQGDPKLQKRVEDIARHWIGPNMANLVFNFIGTGNADVRIAFQQGNGSWSYIGTMCRQIARAEPTMNYGWLTPASSDDEVSRVVHHEFGHALGLIHEHQNPNHPIKWNKDAVYKDLGGPPNNWDKATVDANIFQLYDKKAVTATAVDKDSIMMYPIPASWTDGQFTVGLNDKLSPTDVQFIKDAYPW
jgi:serralysin